MPRAWISAITLLHTSAYKNCRKVKPLPSRYAIVSEQVIIALSPNSSHRTMRERRCSMRQLLSSARIGPIIGLVGSIIVLICYYFWLPLSSLVSEWNSTPWQANIDPMLGIVLLAALVVFCLSLITVFRPHSPALGGMGVYAASLGLLAQLYIFLYSLISDGGALTNPSQLFSLLISFVFAGGWLLLLGFLLGGGAMALVALKAERRTSARAEESQSSQEEVNVQENVWSIGKLQILAMIVGILLYSVLSNIFIWWEGPGEYNIVTVFPAVVFVLFFGITYGPWVGLVIGGVGCFLNNAISTLTHAPYWMFTDYGALNSLPLNAPHPHVYWPLVVGDALIGFIVGLPLFGATRRDKTVRSLLAVMLRSALSIVVGLSVTSILYSVGQPVAEIRLGFQSDLTSETVPTLLVVVLLLPLLLILAPAKNIHRRESRIFL